MIKSVALALVILSLAGSAAPAQTPRHIRGTVASLDGDVLHLRPDDGGGEQTVTLSPQSKITALIPADPSSVKPGSFIGTAAETQSDGTLVAKEIHIFPEAMRGAGEGHRSFDLGPKSTMTNGTIGNEVTGASGNTLTVKYKGGEKDIRIPPGIPIVTFVPGERDELSQGAHVIVFGSESPDGHVDAGNVVVGRGGLVPPM